MANRSVSIILPTYNESGNIAKLVGAVAENIPPGWDYEILVVDDNSPDDTLGAVTRNFGNDPHVVSVLRTTDRGFAKSIRAGIERATGEQIIVMDSDLTHDPIEIPKLDAHAGSGAAGGEVKDVGAKFGGHGKKVPMKLANHTKISRTIIKLSRSP